MDQVTITATDGSGTFKALHARPAKDEAVGAVVLIQEIFGVNAPLRETAQEIAAQGYHVLAPDLFWRLKPGIELDAANKAQFAEALALMKAFDQQKGVDDLRATLAAARTLPGTNGRAGTMGYCLGGRLAMMMAIQSDAEVNISYYGVGLDDLLGGIGKIKTPLLLHIAGEDHFFPQEGRQKVVAAAGSTQHVRAYTYDGADHAFARPGGEPYQARAATIANGRSAEALQDTLR